MLPSKKKTTILKAQYFPGSPMVKTLPSTSGSMGSIPSRELRFYMLCAEAKKKKKKLASAIFLPLNRG